MLKIKILSILGSIVLTVFVVGFLIFFSTGHIELMAISGIIILLVTFYSLIKSALVEKIESEE